MYSVDLAAQRCLTALAGQGVEVSATVREAKTATDLALLSLGRGNTVIRCVAERSEGDARALRAMLSEGDFARAFLVHSGEEADLTSEIQTWPLSRIDELAALLAKESTS